MMTPQVPKIYETFWNATVDTIFKVEQLNSLFRGKFHKIDLNYEFTKRDVLALIEQDGRYTFTGNHRAAIHKLLLTYKGE